MVEKHQIKSINIEVQLRPQIYSRNSNELPEIMLHQTIYFITTKDATPDTLEKIKNKLLGLNEAIAEQISKKYFISHFNIIPYTY